MDLQLKDGYFIVTGAGAGFGRAIAELLLNEGAGVLAVARTEAVLTEFKNQWKDKLDYIVGDITQAVVQQNVIKQIEGKYLSGVLINAGGPPAKNMDELTQPDWDESYRLLVQWKIAFTSLLLPIFRKQNYGRFLFIESFSVKQPVENLILSNTFRPAVVGFAKSLSQEFASENITFNVMAPGYHNTAAMQRLFIKKAELSQISVEEAKSQFESSIPVGRMGEASEMAQPAVWLLSKQARFVTGQTFSHDGGSVKGIFG
ncbi:MAG: SDR family oxidoreductase [Bacteroidales bacterium]|nr:SDR family oxidoreductase [Bacteroidales bacterium]